MNIELNELGYRPEVVFTTSYVRDNALVCRNCDSEDMYDHCFGECDGDAVAALKLYDLVRAYVATKYRSY